MFPKLQCPRQPSSLHSRGRMRSKLRNELWPGHWCMTAVPKDGRLLAMTPSSGWDNNPSGRRGGREESFKSRGSAPASNLPTRRAPCWVSSGVCVEPHNVASIRMMGARAGISWGPGILLLWWTWKLMACGQVPPAAAVPPLRARAHARCWAVGLRFTHRNNM